MFPANLHRTIFLIASIGFGASMMMGAVPTSVPQLILLGNWLLEMDFSRKWNQLKTSGLFWVLISVFLLHLIGLAYSNNVKAGVNDVWIKMPLFFMPLIFLSSKPLNKKEWQLFLYFFLAGTVCNTLWCLLYSYVLHPIEEVRNSSRFMSHIRLGMYVNMAICVAIYFFVETKNRGFKLLTILLIMYFIACLLALGLASGLAYLACLMVVGAIVFCLKRSVFVRVLTVITFSSIASLCIYYVNQIKNAQLTVKNDAVNSIQQYNTQHQPYICFDTLGQKENGYYIMINIQMEELKREWNRNNPSDTFCYSPNHNLKRYEVLLRYLASKGLNKDSAGVAKLSPNDFKNIQKNIPNYLYPEWSFLHKRTYELVNEIDEFKSRGHVNGQSLTMRLHYARAALSLIRDHPIFGIGTGDVQDELNSRYVALHSPLKPEWYKRPHNQFISITLALGFLGLVMFLIQILYPAILFRKHLHVLYWPFLLLLLSSFLFEDTLETQAGLTFYAVFNTLMLGLANSKTTQNLED